MKKRFIAYEAAKGCPAPSAPSAPSASSIQKGLCGPAPGPASAPVPDNDMSTNSYPSTASTPPKYNLNMKQLAHLRKIREKRSKRKKMITTKMLCQESVK